MLCVCVPSVLPALYGRLYDAGDTVKLGFPLAHSGTLFAWGLLEYADGYAAAGQLAQGVCPHAGCDADVLVVARQWGLPLLELANAVWCLRRVCVQRGRWRCRHPIDLAHASLIVQCHSLY